MSLLLALFGHADRTGHCPFSGAKRKTYARVELFSLTQLGRKSWPEPKLRLWLSAPAGLSQAERLEPCCRSSLRHLSRMDLGERFRMTDRRSVVKILSRAPRPGSARRASAQKTKTFTHRHPAFPSGAGSGLA